MSNTPDVDEYLTDVPDGAGCAEIWEKLSECRTDSEPEP